MATKQVKAKTTKSTGSTRLAAVTSASLERRLAEALTERDAALASLAAAREELNALRLGGHRRGEVVNEYPVASGVGPPPLRYVLIDRANEAAKRLLNPLHRAVKAVIS